MAGRKRCTQNCAEPSQGAVTGSAVCRYIRSCAGGVGVKTRLPGSMAPVHRIVENCRPMPENEGAALAPGRASRRPTLTLAWVLLGAALGDDIDHAAQTALGAIQAGHRGPRTISIRSNIGQGEKCRKLKLAVGGGRGRFTGTPSSSTSTSSELVPRTKQAGGHFPGPPD